MAPALKMFRCVGFSFVVRALPLWPLGCATIPAQHSLQNNDIPPYCPSVCSCAGLKWDCGNKGMYLWPMDPSQIFQGVK